MPRCQMLPLDYPFVSDFLHAKHLLCSPGFNSQSKKNTFVFFSFKTFYPFVVFLLLPVVIFHCFLAGLLLFLVSQLM